MCSNEEVGKGTNSPKILFPKGNKIYYREIINLWWNLRYTKRRLTKPKSSTLKTSIKEALSFWQDWSRERENKQIKLQNEKEGNKIDTAEKNIMEEYYEKLSTIFLEKYKMAKIVKNWKNLINQ